MHWTQAIASSSHSRVLNYLADPEHQTYGDPTLLMIAADLGTDQDSAMNLVRPLVEGGMVTVEPCPHGARYALAEVLGEIA